MLGGSWVHENQAPEYLKRKRHRTPPELVYAFLFIWFGGFIGIALAIIGAIR